jgi:hypothetical protein
MAMFQRSWSTDAIIASSWWWFITRGTSIGRSPFNETAIENIIVSFLGIDRVVGTAVVAVVQSTRVEQTDVPQPQMHARKDGVTCDISPHLYTFPGTQGTRLGMPFDPTSATVSSTTSNISEHPNRFLASAGACSSSSPQSEASDNDTTNTIFIVCSIQTENSP